MGAPLSSETVMIDSYLQSGGTQAAKNIIHICRTFRIEDEVIYHLLQSFDEYKQECYNNAAALEEAQIKPLLRAYKTLGESEKNSIGRELQFELLSDKNTVVNKFNYFISLLNVYSDLFKQHQAHTLKVKALLNKTKQKIIDKLLQSSLEKFISTTLEAFPTLAEKEAWMNQICANLEKVNEKEDFLAAFFVSPFMPFSEISFRIKESLAKLELTEGCHTILQSLITVHLATLARELSISKPQFQEKTWREAKDIYQRVAALSHPDTEAFQALLKKAQEIDVKQQQELNDLERKRNFAIRYELQNQDNFNEVLVALKANVGWQDSWTFDNKKRSLRAQIDSVNHCVQSKKENPNLNIADFFKNNALESYCLTENPSIPESFFETLPSESENFEPQTKSSVIKHLKHYGPMVATGIAAFGVGFYSLPWMVCVLAVGTLVSLHYQEESSSFYDAKTPQKPINKNVSPVPVSDLGSLKNNLDIAPTLTPAKTLAEQAEKSSVSVSEQLLEKVDASKVRAQRLKVFAK